MMEQEQEHHEDVDLQSYQVLTEAEVQQATQSPRPSEASATRAPRAPRAPREPREQPNTNEQTPQDEIVNGLWNMWSTVSEQATKLMNEVEIQKNVDKAVKISKGLAVKAVVGMEQVMEAFDPIGGVGMPAQMKVIVTSTHPAKLMAIEAAVAKVFPVSDVSVSGVEAKSGVASQPIGFAAGQRGAENRLVNMKELGAVDLKGCLMLSIESFIVEIESNWYDMACVILRDDAKDLSHVAFSQGIRVPQKYVDAAMAATPASYPFKSTGLEMTVGDAIHEARPVIPANDWQGPFTNGHLKRASILEQCVVGVMGEYLVELCRRRAATVKTQPVGVDDDLS